MLAFMTYRKSFVSSGSSGLTATSPFTLSHRTMRYFRSAWQIVFPIILIPYKTKVWVFRF